MRTLLTVALILTTGCATFGHNRYPDSKRVIAFDTRDDFDKVWNQMLDNCEGASPRVIKQEEMSFGLATKMWVYYSCEK